MAYTRRQGTTPRTATNKVVTTAAVDDLDETEQGQEELEEDDADNEDEGEEEPEETEAEEPDEPSVVAATIPVTAPATVSAPAAPADELEVPTGSPAEQIRQCYFELGKMLEELLSDPNKCKRLAALVSGSATTDENGKRPGDYWLQTAATITEVKRQATNALVAQAMRQ